jgi:hypothetical protein
MEQLNAWRFIHVEEVHVETQIPIGIGNVLCIRLRTDIPRRAVESVADNAYAFSKRLDHGLLTGHTLNKNKSCLPKMVKSLADASVLHVIFEGDGVLLNVETCIVPDVDWPLGQFMVDRALVVFPLTTTFVCEIRYVVLLESRHIVSPFHGKALLWVKGYVLGRNIGWYIGNGEVFLAVAGIDTLFAPTCEPQRKGVIVSDTALPDFVTVHLVVMVTVRRALGRWASNPPSPAGISRDRRDFYSSACSEEAKGWSWSHNCDSVSYLGRLAG